MASANWAGKVFHHLPALVSFPRFMRNFNMHTIAHHLPQIHRPLLPLFAWAETHHPPTIAPRLVGYRVDAALQVFPIWEVRS